MSFDRPIIASCGSGVTAAVVVLALATLDVPDVTLYDGAWSEWGARTDLPVEPLNICHAGWRSRLSGLPFRLM